MRRPDIAWGFILAAFMSLLASSYFDIIRGPLLPAVAAELGLEFAQSGWFLATGQAVAAVATLLMIAALNRWSERTVMIFICSLGLCAGLFAPLVASFGALLFLAGLLGMTVSMLGTMCNILLVEGAPLDLRSRFLAGMHTMYGIGSMSAASFVGFGLGHGFHWSTLYLVALPLYAALLVFSWKKLKRTGEGGARTVQSARLTPMQALVVVVFALYVAGEVSTSMWMTTFLVKTRGFTVSEATPYLSLYFLAMAVTRFGCAFWLKTKDEKFVLRLALCVPLVASALAWSGRSWALPLIGLFGPFFPVFLARTSRRFPDKWRSITIWSVVIMNVSIGIANVSVGSLADHFGINVAFRLPALFLALALGGMSWYLSAESQPFSDSPQ